MTDTTRYSPAMIPVARTLAARGALDKDLAAAFGVPFKTIREWRQRHPDFAAACRLPRNAADEAVERALFRKATGYDRETERVFLRDDELVRSTVTEHVPPCDKAATFWLRVRRPDRWGAPPPVTQASADALSPTEETLREIESGAYDAWCAAVDGEPAMDGDEDTLARIDALIPLADAPADDADPLHILGTPTPHPSSQPFDFAQDELRLRRTLGSLSTGDRSAVEKDPSFRWDDGEGRQAIAARDTLPHRIHPPLPGLITAPIVEPLDADPPAPGPGYDPAFVPIARQFAEQGALDRDLTRVFGISPATLRQWTLRHAAFGAAVRLSKSVADDAVEDALFARATGYAYLREKLFLTEEGEVQRTDILVEQPPSLAAILFWLRRHTDRWSLNRRPDLDPDEAARLIAETRERVAEFDLHRRHWRDHGCAPPGHDEPAPPLWLRDEGFTTDDEEDDSGWDEEREDDFRARVDAFIAARMRGGGCG